MTPEERAALRVRMPALHSLATAARRWKDLGDKKVAHVLTCKACEHLEATENRWCEVTTEIGLAQLEHGRAIRDAVEQLGDCETTVNALPRLLDTVEALEQRIDVAAEAILQEGHDRRLAEKERDALRALLRDVAAPALEALVCIIVERASAEFLEVAREELAQACAAFATSRKAVK